MCSYFIYIYMFLICYGKGYFIPCKQYPLKVYKPMELIIFIYRKYITSCRECIDIIQLRPMTNIAI